MTDPDKIRAGMAASGKKIGRPRTDKEADIRRMLGFGWTVARICREAKVGRGTVIRVRGKR